AQRLVRTLCPHCREKCEPDAEAWKQLVRPWTAQTPAHMWRATGCLECRDTGYLGRQGIYEIMPLTETLKRLVSEDCHISALRLQAMKEGMRTLRLSGAQKVG
ncbi:MAG TPA: type II secretion system protein E, partial [Porticoccaceae bacterium]|nr:type II secretion system protein E [Porticoccaceae bacterium]